MKEIKATAPTREELFKEIILLRARLERQERKMRLWRGFAYKFNSDFLKVRDKTND